MGYEEQAFPRSPCYKRILNSAAAADLVALLGRSPPPVPFLAGQPAAATHGPASASGQAEPRGEF